VVHVFLGSVAVAADLALEDRERMFTAFDRSNAVPGVLVISFTNGIEQQDAEAILQEFNLHIASREVCSSDANPGGIITPGPCVMVNDWNEGLNVATVAVASGEERATAEALIAHPDILWVEPDFLASIADGAELEPLMMEGQKSADTVQPPLFFSRSILIALGIVFILALGFFITRTKKSSAE